MTDPQPPHFRGTAAPPPRASQVSTDPGSLAKVLAILLCLAMWVISAVIAALWVSVFVRALDWMR